MKFISARFVPSLAVFCLFHSGVFAADFVQPRNEPSAAQNRWMERANLRASRTEDSGERATVTVKRPFSEFERGKYVLISASSAWDSFGITAAIARNLPAGMKLIVLATDSSQADAAQATYGRYLNSSRMQVLNLGTGTGIWVRDSLPIPVWTDNKSLALVDAKYYHGFEPDSVLAQAFRTPLLRHDYYFEGGNLMNDDQGNCFIINKSQTQSMSDSVFRQYYGCQSLERLPHVAGIGHVDERLKILSGKRAVTDEPTYVNRLKNLGYEVTLVPRPRTSMGTYANALLVNGTVFLPTYQESGDRVAQEAYENLGFKVVPVSSSQISSQGKGSIHCITMVYPAISQSELLAALLR